MQRILTTTGTAAGDGLLKRALELRRSAQAIPPAEIRPAERSTVTVEAPLTDEEKKKLSRPYWKRAA